ncbi:MAG: hypothetical protein CL927_05940 [Deltaproteobacteria bacterium]|nr:hypothetical protein [Deltaproteobacteria bacterium]HCH62260.1 hypothetical protein [Deltaproteobacteria bacterium]
MSSLIEFASNSWAVTAELAPWLFLGAAVSGLIHVALPPGFIHRQLSGRSGVLKAVALGVPMPLCSCGVIPTGIGLKQDGASHGASVGFITATPQTGLDSILVSASFLGWPFALTKVVAALVTGVAGGLVTDLVAPPDDQPPESKTASCSAPGARNARAAFDHGMELMQTIWGWLAFGVLLSAALSTWMPVDFLSGLAAYGTLAAFGVVLAASVPLYVCATASVPIAASLVAGGMPTGAAMVFLMAGPATNAATLGTVYRTFGGRTVGVYLGTIILGSVAFGIGYEAFFGPFAVDAVAVHAHGASWWEHLCAGVFTAMLAWFALEDFREWSARRSMAASSAAAEASGAPIVVQVGGMTCGGCSSRLARLLREEEGVASATVSLEEAQARVLGSVSASRVREIVESAGFDVRT